MEKDTLKNKYKQQINYLITLFSIGPKRAGDSKYVVANPTKFIKTMKWKPKFNNIKKIIISAVNWEKKLKII